MKTLISILSFCVLSCAAADDGAGLVALQERIARLETGVQGAEAIRAVKRLQYAYGHYAEFGLWHDFADLFADIGVGHYPSGDLGKEGIRKLFHTHCFAVKLLLLAGGFSHDHVGSWSNH